MSWYISPPGGNIPLQKLTQFAITRFNFLCKLYDTGGNRVEMFDIVKEHGTVLDSECLIEGTAKDKVSHFILRLACCKNDEMRDFFVKAETMLFDFRVSCMTENELCKLLKSLDHYIKSLNCRSNHSNLPLFIKQFLETMLEIRGHNSRWRTVIRQYLKGETSCFTVPFQTVLQFVRTRQVILRNGIAHVPVCKLRETVTSLYEKLIIGGMKRAYEIFHPEDERVIELVRTIKVLYRKKYGLRRGMYHNNLENNLAHTDVDDLVHMFPPCMIHLHQTLRDSHRLRHHSRIQYTLFLKEAGLPVHEALMFWRKEYSQPHRNQDGCTHDWSKNENRYTYNIRHLYGLEGSRVNYRGHSCAALQENYHGPHEDGGCPFSHFDLAHLGKLLEKQGISKNTEVIQHLAGSGKFSRACCLFLEEKVKALEENRSCGQVDNFSEQSILHSYKSTGSSYGECMTLDAGHKLVKYENCITSDAVENQDILIKTRTSIQKALESHQGETCSENIESCAQVMAKCTDNDNSGCSVIMSSQTVIVKPIDFFTSYKQITYRRKSV